MRRSIRAGESVTEVIIRAVADQTNREPTALRPLGETIDPDALDSLFTRSSEEAVESLTLIYEGCRITIGTDTVTVQEIPRPSDP